MKKIFFILSIVACGGKNGAAGPQGPAGSKGADGTNGANGQNGVDGQNGGTGPAGPIDATVPPAVAFVHLRASPLGPPNAVLAWNLPSGGPALSAVKIYRSLSPFDDTSKASVDFTTASGDATFATVQIAPESGPIYFAVAAVSYTGVEGSVAPFVLDTTVRLCASGTDSSLTDTVACADGFSASDQFKLALSPNNTSALVVADDDATLGLVDFEQPAPSVQTVTVQSRMSAPAFSPDGSAIAFLSDAAEITCFQDLYVVAAAAGSTPTRLTGTNTPAILRAGGIRPAICSQPIGTVFSFQWSPDGSHLLYLQKTAANEIALHTIAASGGASVNWMTIDPANQITDSITTAAYSPDGKFIALTTLNSAGTTASVWIADILAQTLRSVPVFNGDAQSFAWSWDSARLAVMSNQSPKLTVFSLSDGSEYTPAEGETDSYGSQGLSFSPDGHWLAAVGAQAVVVYPTDSLDGAALFDSREVVTLGALSPGCLNMAASGHGWSPDSRYFAFTVTNDNSSDGAYFADTTTGMPSQVGVADAVFLSWLADGKVVVADTSGNITDIVPVTGNESTIDLALSETSGLFATTFAPPPPLAP